MIVAFCGMDGSGKTTLSQKLKEELIKRGHSVVVVEPFKYVIWVPFLRLLGGGKRLASPQGERRNKFFLFKFWPLLALLDHWIQFLFQIKPLERKYDYVICDRFFFDFAASFSYFGYTTGWLNKLYLRLIPKPNLTFILDLSPKAALAREKKGRHSLEFFFRQREYYLGVVKRFSLQKLDASVEVQKLLEKVLGLL